MEKHIQQCYTMGQCRSGLTNTKKQECRWAIALNILSIRGTKTNPAKLVKTELGVANALSVTQSVSLWALGLHRVVICFAHRKSGGGGTRKVHHFGTECQN